MLKELEDFVSSFNATDYSIETDLDRITFTDLIAKNIGQLELAHD